LYLHAAQQHRNAATASTAQQIKLKMKVLTRLYPSMDTELLPRADLCEMDLV
jgi:acetyl-CoA acetyltransferase